MGIQLWLRIPKPWSRECPVAVQLGNGWSFCCPVILSHLNDCEASCWGSTGARRHISHRYNCAHTWTCTQGHTDTFIETHTDVNRHTWRHTHKQTCIYTRIQTNTHRRIHTETHKETDTYKHGHTHRGMRSRARAQSTVITRHHLEPITFIETHCCLPLPQSNIKKPLLRV